MRIFESNYPNGNGLFPVIVLSPEDVLPYYDVSGYFVENSDYDPEEEGSNRYTQLSWDSDFCYDLDLEDEEFFEDSDGTPAIIDPRGLYYSYWNGSNHVYVHLTDNVNGDDYTEITDDLSDYDSWEVVEVITKDKGRRSLYRAYNSDGEAQYVFHYESFYQGVEDVYYILPETRVKKIPNESYEENSDTELFAGENFVYLLA